MRISFELPDELATSLRRTPDELQYDSRLRALAGLVERGLISSGRAAEVGGVSRREFLDWCGRWQIRLHHWSEAEVEEEVGFAQGREPR